MLIEFSQGVNLITESVNTSETSSSFSRLHGEIFQNLSFSDFKNLLFVMLATDWNSWGGGGTFE